jgi:hypothetical protein
METKLYQTDLPPVLAENARLFIHLFERQKMCLSVKAKDENRYQFYDKKFGTYLMGKSCNIYSNIVTGESGKKKVIDKPKCFEHIRNCLAHSSVLPADLFKTFIEKTNFKFDTFIENYWNLSVEGWACFSINGENVQFCIIIIEKNLDQVITEAIKLLKEYFCETYVNTPEITSCINTPDITTRLIRDSLNLNHTLIMKIQVFSQFLLRGILSFS